MVLSKRDLTRKCNATKAAAPQDTCKPKFTSSAPREEEEEGEGGKEEEEEDWSSCVNRMNGSTV